MQMQKAVRRFENLHHLSADCGHRCSGLSRNTHGNALCEKRLSPSPKVLYDADELMPDAADAAQNEQRQFSSSA